MIPKSIGAALETARLGKGLSQRALSAKVGLPQSQISKIESGAVDARLSTVTEIARALDLELSLVPRTVLPAMQALASTSLMLPARGKTGPIAQPAPKSRNPMRPLPTESKNAPNMKLVLKKPQTSAAHTARTLPAYRLDDDGDDE